MNTGDYLFLSSSICLSMSYRFQCAGFSCPWLNLFLGFFVLFDVIVNGIVFLISLLNGLLVFGKATDFCTLFLYSVNLVNFFSQFFCEVM